MTLIIIKLGDKEYNGKKGDEGFELLRFLNAIMYPHKDDFMEMISDYVDFSENEELWKEEPCMFSLSQCIYEDGKEQGIEQGEDIKLIALVQRKLRKGKSTSVIAEELEESLAKVEQIIEAIEKCGLDAEASKIYEQMQAVKS